MGDTEAKQLIARWERIRDKRTHFENQWQDVADHEAARRDFIVKREPGKRRMNFVYDTTALHQGGLLAAGLHTLLSNPATKWFNLVTAQASLMMDVDVQGWLDAVEDHLLTIFRAPARGFNAAMHETYVDEVWFGTAGLFVDDVPGRGAMFSARPLRELYLEENEWGQVDTVFRKIEMTAGNAVRKFKNRAGDRAQKAVDNDNWEDPVTYLHAMVPNDKVDRASLIAANRMGWKSTWVAFEEQLVTAKGGFEELPIMTPRWEKNSDEVFGRGPGISALPDAMMLNEMSRTVLTAAQKAANPPMMVEDDNVLSNVRLHPGGMNIVRSDSLRENPIRPLPVDQRAVGLSAELLAQRQANVRQHFLPELLQLIQNTGKTPMTATQVVELSNTFMSIVAPLLGRQQSELHGRLLDRVFAIELRAGRLGRPPTLLSGQKLEIEYQSPATRAQRQAEIAAIQQLLQDAAGMAQLDPGVLHNLDLDEATRRLAQFRGVPASVVVSIEDVLARRKAEAALAQERAEMEAAQAAAGVAAQGAQAVKTAAEAESAVAAA